MTAPKKKPPAKKKKTGGGAAAGRFRPGRLLIRLGWVAFWAGVLLTVSQFIWPDIGRLATENPETTALIEARQEEAQKAGRPFKPTRRFVGYDNISPYLIQAVLIAEDDSFLSHSGFDVAMIKRAIEKNLDAGRLKYGASTITQQLAKNLWLSVDKTWPRKFREAIYTWRLEKALPKKRILELYLNVVEWGAGPVRGRGGRPALFSQTSRRPGPPGGGPPGRRPAQPPALQSRRRLGLRPPPGPADSPDHAPAGSGRSLALRPTGC